ncbi:MAG: MFS transporter [Alphaproteobacteria bacterium]|nr:MFS transporter [Alphaproteobacteria bacterium]
MSTTGDAYPTKRTLILTATVLGSSLAFIDGAVVHVALADMQRSLGASVGELQWISNSYMLCLGALLLLGGAMGDRLGRRRVFIGGVALFAVASVACAAATTPTALIFARAVQGVGAAFLVPNSLAILSAAHPREERGRAIGAWSGFAAVATAGGPVLGGWLVDALGWPAVFWINPPIAVLTILLAVFYLPESRDTGARGSMDIMGAVLAVAGLGLISWALIALGETGAADPLVSVAAVVGLAMLALFVRVEARCGAPLMPLGLFRSRDFTAANLLTLLLYGALGAAVFLFPFALIRLHGYSATEAGAAFLPFPLTLFLLARWGGGLIDRYGPRPPLVAGPLVAAVGLALIAWPITGTPYWSTFLPGVLVLGAGMAVCIPPLTTSVMNAVDDRHAGVASAVNNAASRVAGLLAVAAVGPVLMGVFFTQLEPMLATLPLDDATRAALLANPSALATLNPPDLPPAIAEAVIAAARDALIQAFRVATFVLAGLAVASAVVAAIAYGPREPRAARLIPPE